MVRKTLVLGLFIALIAMLAGYAAAQGSCYRYQVAYVSAPMNIRQAHSTGSQIVRKAAAGESLTISSSTQGKTYCWLNVSDGWMAWTTRVSASAPAAATAPSVDQPTQPPSIDNCCFVNRQCHTNQEWVSGYWAFQRNECPVSGQTPQQTVTQPESSTPAGVDNCCFIGWQCRTDGEFVRGYWAYKSNQCAAGPPPSRSDRAGNIKIEGSESFQIWVKAGLDLLKRRAPQWYDYVQGATRKLKERPAESGAFVDVAAATHHTAWDANIIYPSDLNIFTIAHEMVHEACHIYQYRRGDSREQVHQEKECIEREIELFPLIDPQRRYKYRWESWQHTAANMLHDRSLWWW